MIQVDLKALLGKLSQPATSALEAAAGLCMNQGCYEVAPDHLLLKLIEIPEGDVKQILRQYEIEPGRIEAVRQRPYSVVLLHEVEKADREVMNLFYQVFDKGVLADGGSREVDFKNTIICMTSNLGSDVTTQLCATGIPPTPEQVSVALLPVLSHHFNPALLARMTVVPLFPIGADVMREIAELKLAALARRLLDVHRIRLRYDGEMLDRIIAQCTDVDMGARNVDHIMRGSLIPCVSSAILEAMGEERFPNELVVRLGNDDSFKVSAAPDTGE